MSKIKKILSNLKQDHPTICNVLSLFALFLVFVGLDYGLRYMHNGCAITAPNDKIPLIFTLCYAVLFCAVAFILPSIARKIFTAILGGFFSIMLLVHTIMMYAKGNFFSFSTLMFTADGLKFLDASYLHVRKLTWIIFVCGIIGTVLSVILVPKVKLSKKAAAVKIICTLLVCVLCIVGINLNRELNLTDRLVVHFDIYQQSLIYEEFSDANQSLMVAGLYQYSFRDFCLTYGIYDLFSRVTSGDIIAQLDEYYDSKEIDEDNEYTGLFKDKNLIFIQLEAIDTWLINEKSMPNLYRIQQQSINFTDNYTPLYIDAGTFNTEMIVNTGEVSPFTGSKSTMYSRNSYPYSLANLMVKAGYTANSFHRSGGDVYNRLEVHTNLGYQNYYSGSDMGFDSATFDFDTELMKAYDLITAGDKFFSYIITFSGHGPYKDSMVSAELYDYAQSLLPGETNEMKIHAYAHAYATDLFIGELYDKLEEDGLLDDTVIIFYSDHYDYYTLDTELVMNEKGVTDTNLMTRTPFIIYSKGTPAQTVTKTVSFIDVLPTIVNLFDLDTDGRYYVGNDVFSDNGGYAFFADYSWWDGETYRYALDLSTDEEILARDEEIRTRLEMTWNTLKVNYFATK